MNPGYAGRSNLPNNLKKLFRPIAMTHPDRQLIAQVMLFSQGFQCAELLSHKIDPFFQLCNQQLSPQFHYDFGLRALKSVLVYAGKKKRARFLESSRGSSQSMVNDSKQIVRSDESTLEQEILIESIHESLVPKLVSQDVPLLNRLVADVFPGIQYHRHTESSLKAALKVLQQERHLFASQGWLEKVSSRYFTSFLIIFRCFNCIKYYPIIME